MRIIVTGAAGFIGSKVCEHFKSKGNQVIGVDIFKGKHVDYVFDLAEQELKTVVQISTNDVVIHLAGKTSVSASWVDKTILLTNIKMAWNVAQSGCRIINASSTEVNKESPYGISKLASEYYLGFWKELHGLAFTSLRYGNVYGPRQDPTGEAGVIAIFARAILMGEPVRIDWDGEQQKDYVYVGDGYSTAYYYDY